MHEEEEETAILLIFACKTQKSYLKLKLNMKLNLTKVKGKNDENKKKFVLINCFIASKIIRYKNA